MRFEMTCWLVGKPMSDLLMKSFSNGLEFPFSRMNESNFICMGIFFTKIRNLHPTVTLRKDFKLFFWSYDGLLSALILKNLVGPILSLWTFG